MKVAVFDTYVKKKDGDVMHFDILVPDGASFDSGVQSDKSYLTTKNRDGQLLNSNECRFCHIEEASRELKNRIEKYGCSIIEMEGC